MTTALDPTAPPIRPRHRWRVYVVAGSVVAAAAGSFVLATRDTGEKVTTAGITAAFPVPSHPGWIAADADTLWLALRGDPAAPAGEQTLVQVDIATGAVQHSVPAEGQATFVTHVGSTLIASVQHVGDDAFQPRRLLVLDWSTGRLVRRRGFAGPIDRLVTSGRDLWALQIRPGALWHLDPATLAPIAAPIRLSDGRTLDLAAGAGHLWVTAVDDGQVLRIDPATGAVVKLPVGGSPTGIAVAGGSVWITDPAHGRVLRRDTTTLRPVGDPVDVGGRPTWLAGTSQFVFVADAADGTVSRLDVRSGHAAGPRIRVAPAAQPAAAFAIAPAGAVVWVSSFAADSLTRISATSASVAPPKTAAATGAASVATAPLPPGGEVVARIPVPGGPGGFAVGEGGVWTGDHANGTVTRLDPATNAVVARIRVPRGAGSAAAGEGGVWVTSTLTNSVSRIDPRTNKVVAKIDVGPQPDGVAVSPGAVWVVNAGGPTVSRIDPATNRVVSTIRTGPTSACCSEHAGITAADGRVWVGVPNLDAIVRIDPTDGTIAEIVKLPFSPCAMLVAGAVAVWSAGGGCADSVARVDTGVGRPTQKPFAAAHPIGLVLFSGSLWVAALGSKTLERVDPQTGRIVGRLHVDGLPIRVGTGYGSVWLRDDAGAVLRIHPAD